MQKKYKIEVATPYLFLNIAGYIGGTAKYQSLRTWSKSQINALKLK